MYHWFLAITWRELYPANMPNFRIGPRCLLWISVCILLPSLGVGQTSVDSDRDGLSDDKEHELLERFRPGFMISATDCAIRPARFEPNQMNPKAVAEDGTIYGQVFPVPSSNHLEIHYYALWDHDCGRIKHPLDVEHVSVLVANEQGKEPQALYWYAGAHEKTACDISSGARAEAIGAEHQGPMVWSSSGKHALYLLKAMCNRGCGADSCDDDVELAPNGPVINLGELGAPANGSLWIASSQWALSDKMDSDFSADIIARLNATSGKTVSTLRGSSSVRGTIQGSDAVLDGASIGAQHAGAALETADGHASSSLGKATRATGRSLRRGWKVVFGRKETPTQP
jgi:hypothetical protein